MSCTRRNETGILGLGDIDTATAFPPTIVEDRVDNDVSFDLLEIGDTQVYDGGRLGMAFLDRQGNRITGYANSDCVFVQVVDPDQDEDSYRREGIDGHWDGTANAGQNIPFGPMTPRWRDCGQGVGDGEHLVNDLLGQIDLLDNVAAGDQGDLPHLYVLNPRNGRWAALDLLEAGTATSEFVRVIGVDLVSQHRCVPSLDVRPGDTILAVYQDPSNHSDMVWISNKVAIGGSGAPGKGSTTTFTDASGTPAATYTDVGTAYVKVVDASRSGAAGLSGAVAIGERTFDLTPLAGASPDTFITASIPLAELGARAGDSITATYADPNDPTDTSSDTTRFSPLSCAWTGSWRSRARSRRAPCSATTGAGSQRPSRSRCTTSPGTASGHRRRRTRPRSSGTGRIASPRSGRCSSSGS